MVISYFYCGSIFCILPQCGGAGADEAEITLWSRSCKYQELFQFRIQKKLKYYFTILFSFGSEHVSHMYVSQRGRGKM